MDIIRTIPLLPYMIIMKVALHGSVMELRKGQDTTGLEHLAELRVSSQFVARQISVSLATFVRGGSDHEMKPKTLQKSDVSLNVQEHKIWHFTAFPPPFR